MNIILKLYKEYLNTITKFKFDPIILFIATQLSDNLKETFSFYLLALIIVHIPLITLNTFYKSKKNESDH